MIGMTSASATTYWISATGSDSAAGTSPSTAFATFGKADSVVVPGDTVRVLSGTYNTTVQTYTAGTLSARITWISDTKWGAKIVGSTITCYINDVQIAQASDSTWTTGQPGIGFFRRLDGVNSDLAFSSYKATSL